jgi:hypothetical protein
MVENTSSISVIDFTGSTHRQRPRVTTYCVKLDVPCNLIFFVAGLLRRHRKARGEVRGGFRLLI